MLSVFVLGQNKNPLMPCHPARARELLKSGKAKVFRAKPFTIILIKRDQGDLQDIECKIDPGSKKTGIALVGHFRRGTRAIFAANLEHRGQKIKEALGARRAIRRSRRNRKTRYRKPRFDNRTRLKGWLPPSLRSRVENVTNWVKKLASRTPVTEISIETVRFDMQKIQNPEISGIEYQQGELYGYEIREYLLEKWQRTCAYCGEADIPLEVEHIVAKSKDGSNRVSNLTLACRKCNEKKANRPIEEFLKDKAKLKRVLAQAKAPLKDAAAVNATRYAIGNSLKQLGLPTSFWSGGRTKFNRVHQNYPKDHWIDAVCVGQTGRHVFIPKTLGCIEVKAQGRGTRQKCRVDKYGFPRTAAKSQKRVKGFETGDLVRAVVTKGKKQGICVGRVAVRQTGNFNIKNGNKTIQGINAKYCRLIQRTDGFSYSQNLTRGKGAPRGSDASHRFSPKGVSIPPGPKGPDFQETFG
jgi:5-methylcytosine-specific restriction endonuclease McrA